MTILDHILKWVPAATIIILVLCAWELIVRLRDIASWLLPAPSAIAYALYESNGVLAGHTLVTLEEILIGFILALIDGVLKHISIPIIDTKDKENETSQTIFLFL